MPGAKLRSLGREEVGPITGELIDRSGTITTGGTSQEAVPANFERSYLTFQNHSDTDMWLNYGTAAVAGQPSIKVAAGMNWTPAFVDQRALNVLCATTGKAYTCKEG
jgi:hypothetical protein